MIVLFSLLAICLMSYYLIICEYYDDGIVGRLALAVLSLSAGVGFAQHLTGKVFFDPVSEAIFGAVAVFELRHIYRIFRAKTDANHFWQVFQRILR